MRPLPKVRVALNGVRADDRAVCATRGEEPERPFSGQFVVRLPSSLHRTLVANARREGVSLSRFVTRALEHATTD